MKRLPLSAVICLAAIASMAVFAHASEYTLDFTNAALQDSKPPILRKAEMSSAVGQIPSVEVGDKIDLKLFGDVCFALKVVSKPPAGIAGQSYIARDENGSASAIVKVTASGVRISVDDFANLRQYTVRCKDGKAHIVEYDNSQVDGGECGTCAGGLEVPQGESYESSAPASTKSLLKAGSLLAASSSGNEFPLAEQKSVVDILVAFDKGAKAWAEQGSNWGSQGDSIGEFADYAVNKMNMVLERSQLLDMFSYRLAGVVEIDDTYTIINQSLLGNLRTRAGALAKLSQLREKYGADTITLLIDRKQGNTTGVGFGYYPVSSFPDPASFDGGNYACNICDIKTVYSRYTMSHETGHNMGCDHSTRQGPTNSGPGRFEDSSGYHFVDAYGVRRYTIMGYNYTYDDDYNYLPVPYFSSPDITPEEYGCPLGTNGVHNNRRTLTLTHGDIAGLREHVLPYDWDVRVWEGDHEITEGDYCKYDSYGGHTLTLTHTNSAAIIYYTLDGTEPGESSAFVKAGATISVNLEEKKTLKVCAVVGGIAQSVRTLTLKEGIKWSGESGQSGNGRWSTDQSILSWNDGSSSFEKWATVVFAENTDNSSPSITVMGEIAPWETVFTAIDTAYTFNKNDEFSLLKFRDANFAPAGDVIFNVPVQFSATEITNMTGCAMTFNAPFGQTVDESGGNFSGTISISPNGKMTVSPGSGMTQILSTLNNRWFAGSATFRVGEGTVKFTGGINGGAGVIGRTKLEVGNGGELVFDMGGGTGHQMNQTSLTVEKGGIVRFNDDEYLCRTLYLNGGTIYAKRFDLMSNPGVYVTDDSTIEKNGGGYILIRYFDSEINVSDGKTLTLNVGTQTDNRDDTSGRGIVKLGGGTIVANVELKHSGVTDIEAGTLTVGYSSSARYGLGWIVANDAKLEINSGCALSVPNLTLDSGATVSVPASSSSPLTATNAVSVAGVAFELTGMEGESNAIYPLLHSDGGITGVESIDTSKLPVLSGGSEWLLEVKDNTLYARSFTIVPAEGTVQLVSNVSEISLTMPTNAMVNTDGGAIIGTSPIVVESLDVKKITIIAKIKIPAETPSVAATMCSWRLNNNIIYCVRKADGTLDCFYDNDGYVKNEVNEAVAVTAGEHILRIEYYSESTSIGGTRVLLDGKLAYSAGGLKFSSYNVGRVTFGATAEDTPRFKYPGLVVREAIVIDALSDAPAQVVSGRLPMVDVLVAYDRGAQTYVADKKVTLENFAQTQIDRMNAVLATNRLDMFYAYRLAGVCKVDADYNDINATVSLIQGGAGPCTSLRAARELTGADTVTLLIKTSGNVLGHSSQPDYRDDMASCNDDCFSVCSIDAVDTGNQHTMIHENAHNMGCGHARAQYAPEDLAKDPNKYSYGYYFNDSGTTRHTIMAYGGDNDASWYFSTSSSEFGLPLGDATNDNARVLKETCGEVAKWRESVLPYEDDVIVKVDGTDEEVLSGRVFANSIKLELSAPEGVEAAAIYYTLDGSAPNLESLLYSGDPIVLTNTTTLSLRYVSGTMISPVRTVKIFRNDALEDTGDVIWYTSVKYPWCDDGNGVVRSCNHTNYDYYCTTPLMAKVAGSKTLRFKQKSYFFTPSEGSNYSHFDVLVDDKVVVATNYCDTAWSGDFEVSIEGEGEHAVQFVYSQRSAMNNPSDYKDGAPEANDAVWLKDIRCLDLTTYEVREGETIAYTDLPEGTTKVVGKGTVNCGATLPGDLGWTNATWKGTVAFSGLNYETATQNFQFELYGNANSKIQLTNCKIQYLKNNNATFAGALELASDAGGNASFSTNNGYSDSYNVFGALEGDGTMAFTVKNPAQAYVFNDASDFSGNITVGAAINYHLNPNAYTGRRVVFGMVASVNDLPAQSATITIKSGATASIGAGATWSAYHGVEIAGTLLVKGAGAKLDCDSSAAMGLLLDDGATIRFDSNDAALNFAKAPIATNGTVNIVLGDGVTPTKRQLISWAAKSTGTFSLIGFDKKWVLDVKNDGLYLAKWKPAEDERFDIPGSEDAYIGESAALSSWLDEQNYYSFYEDEMTWQQFIQQTSSANNYSYWQNFMLGYAAENDNRKFEAKIEIVNGEVKITTTEGNIPEGLGVVKRLFKKSSLDAPWDPPEGKIMDGTSTIDTDSPGDSSFYKVEVGFE